MTTRTRRAPMVTTLFLLATATAAAALPAPATAEPAGERRAPLTEQVSADFGEDGVLVLAQDTRTSSRVRLLSHDYGLDVRGDRGVDYVVFFSPREDEPGVYTARGQRVRCVRATGEHRRGGRSTVSLPVRCLQRDGEVPRAVSVRPSVLVLVKREGEDRCRVEDGPRLGPLERGEGEAVGLGRSEAPAPSAAGRRGC